MDNEQVLKELLKSQELQAQLLKAMTTKDAAGTPSFTPLHGAGGIWNVQGLDPTVVTARITPRGIGAVLQRFGTLDESPLYGILTGYTAETGSRPTAICDDAPKGYIKSCILTAQFGLTRKDTQEINPSDAIKKFNRGDMMDLQLMGSVLGMTGADVAGLSQDKILTLVTMNEMMTAAVNAENELAVDLWQGAPATGAMPGLDTQIATGQIDALSNTTCPAVDSDVKDFGYSFVDGTDKDIVLYLSYLEKYLRHNAERMHLDPVQWVIVMRVELWEELSAVWPCRYQTNRCSNSAGTNVAVINDNVNITLRDAMRNQNYIDINGRRYPVVVDDGIYEHDSTNDAHLDPGQYASSIYMVPLTVRGGFPVTYMQYLDYRRMQPDTALLNGTENYWWTNDGMFSWAKTDKKWCYQLHLAAETRVVLRTPHLAGKIQHVAYEPLQHLRSPFADNPYFKDGGVSLRNPTTLYTLWDGRQR